MIRPSLLAVLALGGLATAAAAAPPACVPHLLGSDGRGPAASIARFGDILYVGAGSALLVLDISDEAHPAQLAKLEIGQVVRDLALSGSSTLVAAGLDRLFLVDVSDPERPAVESSVALPRAGWIGSLSTVGDHLFFVALDDLLHVFDLSDPAFPVDVSSFSTDGPYSVAVSGQRAYLSEYAGLRVLDVSDPAHPASIALHEGLGGDLTLSGNGRRLAMSSGCAMYDCTNTAFADLEDPDHPIVHGDYETSQTYSTVVLVGGRAYLGNGEILDLSDLDHPVPVGRLPARRVWDLLATGARAYVASERDGVRIFGVADPANPYEIGSFPTPAPTSGGYLAGDLAVTLSENAVRIFDLSDPHHPALVANKKTGVQPMRGFLPTGEFAVAGSRGSRARVWDLSDPLQPQPAGSFGPSFQEGLAVWGDLALAGEESEDFSGVRIFDLSVPTEPAEIATIPSYVSDVAVRARTAVASTGSWWEGGWVRIYDLTEPSVPVEISETAFGQTGRIALGDSILLGADLWNLGILDLRDRSHPVIGATLDFGAWPQAMALYGSRAVVVAADWDADDWYETLNAVHVLDLTDPAHPVEIASVRVPGGLHEVSIGPGRALVANGLAGMSLLETCAPFADGFESGDASAWSRIVN
jgi:hypothetical protein